MNAPPLSPAVPAVEDVDVLSAALEYAAHGLYVGPLTNGTKHPGSILGKGWEHQTSRDPQVIAAWFAETDRGVFIHAGRSGLVIADIDHMDQVPELLAAVLDYAPYQSTRPDTDPGRGHYLFLQPPGRMLGNGKGRLSGGWGEIRGRNGVIVAEPSEHPDGGLYRWERRGEIPVLPPDVSEALTAGRPAGADNDSAGVATDAEVEAFITAHTASTEAGKLNLTLTDMRKRIKAGESRHDTALIKTAQAFREARLGYFRADLAIEKIGAAFVAAATKDMPGKQARSAAEAASEYCGIVAWAVAQINADPAPETPPGAPGEALEGVTVDGQAEDPAEVARQAGLSDALLAEDVDAEVLDGKYCWSSGLGWMRWDGRRWARTPDQDVIEQVRRWVLRRYADAMRASAKCATKGDIAGADRMAALAKEWRKYQARERIMAVTVLAEGLARVDAADFDAHPDLLNCSNGVVDLRTGELEAHDPDLLMTKLTGCDYVAGARHIDWERALEAVPPDVREWYQVRLGQGITGHMTPDDLLIVQQGSGSNGKTTVMAAVRGAAGDYFLDVNHRALLGDAKQHSTEIADFQGVRLALLEELPEGRHMSVTRLKMLVGTPTITARKMRQDDVSFPATHTMILSTNYLPQFPETDDGTWRRLACVKFPYRFTDGDERAAGDSGRAGDPSLRERLSRSEDEQAEAVLAWLVAGAVEWYKMDRIMPDLPERVKADTRAWRAEADLVMAYLDDNIIFDRASHVMSTDLRADFNEWVHNRGQEKWGDALFGGRFDGHSEMTAHGVVKKKTKATRAGLSRWPSGFGGVSASYAAWFGLRFRTDADGASDDAPDDAPDDGEQASDLHGSGGSGTSGYFYTRADFPGKPETPEPPEPDLNSPFPCSPEGPPRPRRPAHRRRATAA